MSPTTGDPLEARLDRVRLHLATVIADEDPTRVSRTVFEALERAHDDLTTAIAEHRRRPASEHVPRHARVTSLDERIVAGVRASNYAGRRRAE